MAYRDDGEAILARLVALSGELAAAKREITALEQGRGGSAKLPSSPIASPDKAEVEAANIATELLHARTRLADLLAGDGGAVTSTMNAAEWGEKEGTLRVDDGAVCTALRDALRKVLIDKLGSVPAPIASALTASLTSETLTDAIVAASRTDNWNALILRVVRALDG